MAQQRRSQVERRTAAREQILRAALRVFSLKGYAAASMEDIRLATGCSKGGLYHHFDSKRAVLAAAAARLGMCGLPPTPAQDGAAGLGLGEVALARIVLDIWAEAARDAVLAGAIAGEDAAEPPDQLARALSTGMLVASLTRGVEESASTAAQRLGIVREAA
jgi:AcrR family transcriptional regulator